MTRMMNSDWNSLLLRTFALRPDEVTWRVSIRHVDLFHSDCYSHLHCWSHRYHFHQCYRDVVVSQVNLAFFQSLQLFHDFQFFFLSRIFHFCVDFIISFEHWKTFANHFTHITTFAYTFFFIECDSHKIQHGSLIFLSISSISIFNTQFFPLSFLATMNPIRAKHCCFFTSSHRLRVGEWRWKKNHILSKLWKSCDKFPISIHFKRIARIQTLRDIFQQTKSAPDSL